jgi:NAD(P)H dehydrogenase (quinone)
MKRPVPCHSNKETDMKINVTAATGQLGRKTVDALIDQGFPACDIIASARNTEKARTLFDDRVDIRLADYDKPETLSDAFKGTDVLMIIASLLPVEPRIMQHARLIEAAVQANVQRIVFASFAAAEPTSKFLIAPFSLYAESKLRQCGIDWTILRDGMYLDPVADWIPELVQMGRLPYPVRSGCVAYICRDDIARSLAAACLDAGTRNRLYSLTGPHAVSMPELADIISRVSYENVTFDMVSEEEYAEINRESGVPDYLNDVLVSMYRAVDNGELETVTNHVKELTGRPAEDIESYFARVLS